MRVGIRGDLLLSREIPIGPRDNCGTLHDRLAVEGAELLVETLDLLEKGKITPVPQDEALATYARKLKKDDLILDWSAPSEKLLNQIRAFDPWPGARTFLDGKILKVWTAVPGRPSPDLLNALPGTTGEFRKDGSGLPVRTGDGVIELTELQLGGKTGCRRQGFWRVRPYRRGPSWVEGVHLRGYILVGHTSGAIFSGAHFRDAPLLWELQLGKASPKSTTVQEETFSLFLRSL